MLCDGFVLAIRSAIASTGREAAAGKGALSMALKCPEIHTAEVGAGSSCSPVHDRFCITLAAYCTRETVGDQRLKLEAMP
jgi:hypothetical protein